MFAHYTKMALKALMRFKLHSAISLSSLSIGFMCFLSAILLSNYADSFDRGFENSDRIFNLMMRPVGDSPLPDRFPIVNQPAARYLRAAFPEVPNIVRASSGFPQAVSYNGQSITVDAKYIEPRFFDIFPLETVFGLQQGQDLPPNTAALTEEGAQLIFGRTDVVGERIIVENEHDVTVAAVLRQPDFPSHLSSGIAFFNTDLYLPIEMPDELVRQSIIENGGDPDEDRWGNQSDFVYLEFPEDYDLDVAEFNQRLDEFVKSTLPEERVAIQTYELLPVNELVPTQLSFVTGGFDLPDILIAAGALVLLIGCLNYSNLVIAQLSLRSQEVGVQKILGAKRSSLLVQYCYETFLFLMLALVATLVILGFILYQLQAANVVGISPALLLTPSLWSTLLAVMVVIVAIAGGYPALRTALVPLVTMMRPKGSSGYSSRMRNLMVGLQFFISGTLMILATVMYMQNQAMTQQLDGSLLDPKIAINVPADTFDVDPELLATELKRNPAIMSVSQVDILPWSISNSSSSFTRDRDINSTEAELSRHSVGYEYTETMSQALIAGRDFSRDRSSDLLPNSGELTSASGPFNVIIDDMAAQNLGWENATEAIGQSIYRRYDANTSRDEISVEMVVIGAMSERKYEFLDFTAFGVDGHVYMLQPQNAGYLIVRVDRDLLNEGLRHIDSTWSQLMPEVPLKREFVDDLFYQTYGMFLGISASIGILSLFGFFVASIGLLGNATFITNIRQREVGIRKVMGASSNRLLRMLLLDFAKPILIANALAWPLGFFIGQAYTSFFAAQVNINFMPFLVSLGLSAAIAFAAVFSQSLKSARVRPAMVLRYE
ncbi:MAG: FtsX-like permease family protein [Pseudomonadales bacterium]|nr:FtsX-like permease family protein [Pseudomonadales bacterium]